ncbi:MAG TPA: hypothetical protein VF812_11420, partial [Ktedonobacterales bacterium]
MSAENVVTAPATTAPLVSAHGEVERFEVALPGPLDISASLDLFRRSGDDLLDRWDGEWLMRTLSVDGRIVPYACLLHRTVEAPALLVETPRPDDRALVEAALRVTFAPTPEDFAALLRADAVVAELDAR